MKQEYEQLNNASVDNILKEMKEEEISKFLIFLTNTVEDLEKRVVDLEKKLI